MPYAHNYWKSGAYAAKNADFGRGTMTRVRRIETPGKRRAF
jgi:hypothetical protein